MQNLWKACYIHANVVASAVTLLTNTPKISYLTKRDNFRLNLSQSDKKTG